MDREQTGNHSRVSNRHSESPSKQRLNRLGFLFFLNMANSVAILEVRGQSLVFTHSKPWQFDSLLEDWVAREESGGQEDDGGQSQRTDEEDGVRFVGEGGLCCIGCTGKGIPQLVMVGVRRGTALIRMPVPGLSGSPKDCLRSFSRHCRVKSLSSQQSELALLPSRDFPATSRYWCVESELCPDKKEFPRTDRQ